MRLFCYNAIMAKKRTPSIPQDKKLKILFVSPEVAPYSKVGGLADVVWALPRALREMGHDVRIFSPKFGAIDESKYSLETIMTDLKVSGGEEEILNCNVKLGYIPDDIPVYLLENQEYYEIRANVYGYADDTRRWFLLCRGALEFLRQFDWKPDVIHTNDWATGFVANDLATIYKNDAKINSIATVFSIHNIEHQGTFEPRSVPEMEKDDGHSPLPSLMSHKALKLNGMRRGIIYSDVITTVSETYAREILTVEHGAGLDRLLRELRTKLFGVLNGLDARVFDPNKDPDIWFNYDVEELEKKGANKLAFQKEFGLDQDLDVPVVGFVGRFFEQKGLSILMEAIEKLLPVMDFQFIFVGSGESHTEAALERLMRAHPGRVGGHLMISKIIGQQIYAASDIFLYPSKFEPCGLAQLIAMRYGSIPIVRRTGGLADTVSAYDPESNSGTGFIFNEYDATSLIIQIVRAIEAHRHKSSWQALMRRAMKEDFSWGHSAEKYEQLYHKAILKRRQWLKKEGLIMADAPTEVPGPLTISPLG